MRNFFGTMLFLTISSTFLAVLKVVYSEEFCNSDIFEPFCSPNEILHIKNAIYGRKHLGQCIKNEGEFDEYLSKPGYINCYTDVKHIIEPQCAGKTSCRIAVARIKADSKCSNVFKNHFDVDYSCMKGENIIFFLNYFSLRFQICKLNTKPDLKKLQVLR